jgi:peptidoglycan/LPS O-acetylase OafA/YrhL
LKPSCRLHSLLNQRCLLRQFQHRAGQRRRDRRSWHLAGIILTAAWLTYVAIRTGGDPTHPLFDFIFIVPLIAWLLLVLLGNLFWRRRDGDDSGTGP